jgi:single-stranded-DNA-specific exonuclease
MSTATLKRRLLPNDGISADDVHPLLARIYAARGIKSTDDLARGLSTLSKPDQLSGLDRAVELLVAARADNTRVLVVGDFDADGATSCAVALLGLRALGFGDVDYLVPNRFEFGYGLTPEIVALAQTRKPGLLVTVDNGIASIAGVDAARAAGMQVIITDHHLPGDELPRAHAIVNPNVPGDTFPSKHLAGVGVMFYVLLALRAQLRKLATWPGGQPEPNLGRLLDLVALGTVADVVCLDTNNRILVHQGLERIRAGKMRPGLAALLRIGGRDGPTASAADLAFAVGPRLNAAGRLDDMSLGIECLLAESPDAATQMAAELDGLNQARREIEADMRSQAEQAVRQLNLGTGIPAGLCLFEEDWHQGVVGIVASRIKDAVHRPVIAFARDSGSVLKGSARSIPGVHIRDVLDAVATRNPGLVPRFGGHAMAAGLALEFGHLEEFRAAFAEQVAARLDDDQLEHVLWTDGEIPNDRLNLRLAELIRDAGPWGQGFPEPVFEGEFRILDQRVVGANHLKLKLEAHNRTGMLDAIAFNYGANTCPSERVRLAYKLDINQYRGMRTVQLLVEHVESL